MNYGKKISVASSFAIILIAVLVLVAWQFGQLLFENYRYSVMAMNPVTSVLLIVLSTAIILFHTSRKKNADLFIKVSSLCVALAGCIQLFSFLTSANFSIDQMLFYKQLTKGPGGHMAPIAALNFVLLGLAIFCLTFRNKKNITCDIFALAAGLTSLLSLIGYIYKASEFYMAGSSIAMAFHTSICFILLAVSVLAVKKNKGLAADLFSNYANKKIAAIVVPLVIIIPTALGYIRLRGENLGHYTSSYGTVIFTIANIIIFIILIWLVARSLNKVNAALVNEIDARKKFEGELQENNLFLNTIMENIPLALFVKDAKDLKYLRINKYAADFLGLRKEDVLGRTDYEIFSKDEADFIRETDTRALATGKLVLVDEQKVSRGDELLWVETQKFPVVDADNKGLFLIGMAHDITHQKKHKDEIKEFNKDLEQKVFERTRELEKSEKRFRSLIENSVDAIKMMDEASTIFFASRSNEKIIGYLPEEIFQTRWLSHVHPDDYDFCLGLFKEALNEPGITKPFTKRFIHKNKSSVWVEGTITNLLKDESVQALVCNFHDISNRLKIESEKRSLEVALENENIQQQKQIIQATIDGQEKERTAIGMELHDNINQILGAVKLYLGVAKNVPATVSEMLEKSSQNIDLCINEIRKLSKALVNPNMDKVTLNEAITSIIDSLKESTDIDVLCLGCNEVSEKLNAKKQLAIYRILQELVTNIVNHAEAKAVKIEFSEVNGNVVLSVIDNGKGFDVNSRQKGIGLANIKNRIEVMNGEFAIETFKNKGSSFKVTIPIAT